MLSRDLTSFISGVVMGWLAGPRDAATVPLLAPTLVIHRGPSPLACFVFGLFLISLTALVTTIIVSPGARAALHSTWQKVRSNFRTCYLTLALWCVLLIAKIDRYATRFWHFVTARLFINSLPTASNTANDTVGIGGVNAVPESTPKKDGRDKQKPSNTGRVSSDGWVLVPSRKED